MKTSHKSEGDECQQTPALHLLLAVPPPSALGGLLRKTQCPLLSVMLFLAHTVGVQATF